MLQEATAGSGTLASVAAPALCYFDMMILDYGLARVFYNNRHKLSHEAWRSAQPAPHQIALAARRGVRTIVNLRGDQSFGTQWLEARACARHGINLVTLKLRSRAAPSRDELFAIKELLETAEYPLLIHCKSGADRAGLTSVLYRHVRLGEPIAQARGQLSLKFGHIRQADTGVLDAVFDKYLEHNAHEPMPFWEWVATRYDPEELSRTFKAGSLANRLVNGVLRRE